MGCNSVLSKLTYSVGCQVIPFLQKYVLLTPDVKKYLLGDVTVHGVYYSSCTNLTNLISQDFLLQFVACFFAKHVMTDFIRFLFQDGQRFGHGFHSAPCISRPKGLAWHSSGRCFQTCRSNDMIFPALFERKQTS